MAAYAAVTSLIHLLDQLHYHPFPPISLDSRQVGSLNEIAAFLQQFLEAYESPFAYSDEADPLEIRIINAAYAAEDAIESHIVKVIKTTTASRQKIYNREETESDSVEQEEDDSEEENFFEEEGDDSKEETGSKEPNFVEEEDDDSEEENSVEEEGEEENSVEEDDSEEEARSSSSEEMNMEVSFIDLYEDLHQVIEEMDSIKKVAMKIDAAEKEVVPDFSSGSSSTEQRQNTTMVGCDDMIHEIMKQLLSETRQRQVIPITGMAGIGKTTLARTVYSKPLVKEHFDVRIWVTISQKYNTRKILFDLYCQATNANIELSGYDFGLATNIKKEEVEKVDEFGLKLHKILFGRRFLIVIDDMWSIDEWNEIERFIPDNGNGSRVLVTTRLSGLSSQLTNGYSLEMKFLDRVCSWELFSKSVFREESCPLEFEEIGKQIVHDCKGLPLSIVVVGGVLREMERTRECWESIRRDLTLIVNLENDEHCLRLLKLSYNHLPAYLKPCFLYMGMFVEDDATRVSTIIKLWVSEGFLKPMNGQSLETIAKGYLRDLIGRNLILIDGFTRSGDVKYCKIHDLLRDLCLREAHKYGFYDVMGQRSIRRGMNSQRRLVISERTPLHYELQSMPLVRSIICEYGITPSCENFGLLRILHACKFGAYADGRDVNTLAFQCVNLRHIAVRVNGMSSFPSSIILAWNLHTLIVDCKSDCKAPIGIWKMAQFRHIEFRQGSLYLPDPDGRVVVMENLQILKGVMNFKCGEEVFKRCPNLTKLRIICFGREVIGHHSLINIERLSKLESLDIWCRDPLHVHELTLPHSLKSLRFYLFCGAISEDVLGKIGSLPLLQKLKLMGWEGWFGAGKWEIADDQFPCLKYLSLDSCIGLKHWTAAQEGSSIFPRLEHLHLYEIDELEIPCEIGDIATLQKIELVHCSKSVVMSARDIVEEQVELQGEDLSFHVEVCLYDHQEELRRSLAGHPNFILLN